MAYKLEITIDQSGLYHSLSHKRRVVCHNFSNFYLQRTAYQGGKLLGFFPLKDRRKRWRYSAGWVILEIRRINGSIDNPLHNYVMMIWEYEPDLARKGYFSQPIAFSLRKKIRSLKFFITADNLIVFLKEVAPRVVDFMETLQIEESNNIWEIPPFTEEEINDVSSDVGDTLAPHIEN
jgi:hypothetical protein